MNIRDIERAQGYENAFLDLIYQGWSLPGISDNARRRCLSRQIVDSLRRVEYARLLSRKKISQKCAVPYSGCFDPLKAAVLHNRAGLLDEAWWLVFLATHFGKHASDGWQLTESVYGALGQRAPWTWSAIQADKEAHLDWVRKNHLYISRYRFSSHRQYRSHKPFSDRGTAAVIESYLGWVGSSGKHGDLVQTAHRSVGQNPKEVFDFLYDSMGVVKQFGRLGRFDFLTMLEKLQIAPIQPGTAYLKDNATGPLRGARLLFDGNINGTSSARSLDRKLVELGEKIDLGMQELEDSLCNWQKNPENYTYFRG